MNTVKDAAAQDLFARPPVRDIVKRFRARGEHTIRLRPRTKRPFTEGWPSNPPDEANAFQPDENVGLANGIEIAPGKFTVDLDPDWPEAQRAADLLALDTGFTYGRGGRITHRGYTTDVAFDTTQVKCGKETVCEMRGRRSQSMAPGSVHPEGDPIVFFAEGDRGHYSPLALALNLRMIGATALLARVWLPNGPHTDQHASSLAIAGFLVHRAKCGQREAELIIRTAATIAGDENVQDRVNSVASTVAQVEAGKRVETDLRPYVEAQTIDALRKLFRVATQEEKSIEDKLAAERERRLVKRTVTLEENPPKPIPPIQTLQARLALPRPRTVWRIEHLQQVGHRVLVAAQAKTGKTTLTINLSRCLVDPTAKFLDRYEVQQVDLVTILDFEMAEDDPGQLDDWYREADIRHPERIKIVPLRGRASAFNILDQEVRARWAEQLRGSTYLIWDCVSTVVMALGLDENLEAQRLLTAFDELLQEAGIHEALVVQHMGHNNERARGSSGFLAWPDVLWTLVKQDPNDDTSKRFIKAFGRGVELHETELLYNEQTHRLALGDGGNRKQIKVKEALEAIVELLAAGPRNTSAIEDDLPEDVGRNEMRAALKMGVERGMLTVGDGPKNAKVYAAVPRDQWPKEGRLNGPPPF